MNNYKIIPGQLLNLTPADVRFRYDRQISHYFEIFAEHFR